MKKKEEDSTSSFFDTFIIPDKNSFEISYWFYNTRAQIRQIEINLDKKGKNDQKRVDVATQDIIHLSDESYNTSEIRNTREKSLQTWKSYANRLLYDKIRKRLLKGKRKLDEQKGKRRKAPKKRNTKISPQEIISQTSSGFRDDITKSNNEEETEIESPTQSKYREDWISFAKRFTKQTKYNTLIQEQAKLVVQRKREKIERQERFCLWAAKLVQNDQIQELHNEKDKLDAAFLSWSKLVPKLYFQNNVNHIKSEYDKWKSLKFQNPDQIQSVWRCYSSYLLRFNYRIRGVQEFFAMERLKRFFQYVIIPRRAMHVVDTMELPFQRLIQRETRKEIVRSARKIRHCSLQYRNQISENFAVNFTEAISDAFTTVAVNHLGPPEAPKPKQKASQKPHVKMPKRKPIPKKSDTKQKQTRDQATNPVEDNKKQDNDVFIEDHDSNDDLLGELVEHNAVNIEIDNNSESALPPNIKIVQIIHEEPSSPPKTPTQKPEFSTINNDEIVIGIEPSEEMSKMSNNRSPNYILSTTNREKPKLEMSKNQSQTIIPKQNAAIQTQPKPTVQRKSTETQKSTSSGKQSSDKQSSEMISDIMLSAPSISRIMEMYGSGSSLEEINNSVEEELKLSEFDLINSGSPIKSKGKPSNGYEEESYQTETPPSSAKYQSLNSSPRSRFQSVLTTSSSFNRTPQGTISNKTEKVDLLEQHNTLSLEPESESKEFVPYRIDEDEYSEENEEESFLGFDFTEEEEEEENNEQQQQLQEEEDLFEEEDDEVPFIFSDDQMQSSKKSSDTNDNLPKNSEPKFVFTSTSNENISISSKSDGPNFVFSSNENISIPSSLPQQQQPPQEDYDEDSVPEKNSAIMNDTDNDDNITSHSPVQEVEVSPQKKSSDGDKSPAFNFTSSDAATPDDDKQQTPQGTPQDYTYSYYSPDFRPTPSASSGASDAENESNKPNTSKINETQSQTPVNTNNEQQDIEYEEEEQINEEEEEKIEENNPEHNENDEEEGEIHDDDHHTDKNNGEEEGEIVDDDEESLHSDDYLTSKNERDGNEKFVEEEDGEEEDIFMDDPEEEEFHEEPFSVGVSSDFPNQNDSKITDEEAPDFNFGNQSQDSTNDSIDLESMSPAKPLNSSSDRFGVSPGGFFLTGV
ncbi:hypothetical protein TVAG_292570 [Trichomonas vaginalis G3]|uniref:Uncharacterized protein n=1 Tax=Trichomonas vaginalis (strain ATCC PRA-98 / G3) TaxID=412133 RepID=A2F0C9_TRIV3|nr:hypothetical protein TVAGG3_0216430 [Trichomonas vaginalis G3]EAY01624.1 hypothetical protein TVAG_292570 [Trichomonas vaginalis G3]KAI5551589.1 hypothetical protein TVAGG3_0216430 [Trichomonas vaginalis G3]|eukprot:XP_001330356.1 hypothetical protein [Trichomonas vaginalis G3]